MNPSTDIVEGASEEINDILEVPSDGEQRAVSNVGENVYSF